MTEQFFRTPAALARLDAGPLGPHMTILASLLSKRGYAKATLRKQLRAVADLSHWLEEQGLRVDDVDEESIFGFEEHAPRSETVRKLRAVFPVLLEHLREIGAVAPFEASPPGSALDCTLDDFSQYLAQQRSLAQTTITKYCRVIRGFLDERFGSGPILAGELSATDVRQFVLRRTQTGGNVREVASALRSFLRGLRLYGEIESRAPRSPRRGCYRAAIDDADLPISTATRKSIASSRPPAICARRQACAPRPTRRFSASSRSLVCGWGRQSIWTARASIGSTDS